ncbi:sugar transferase [Anaerococcus sp.]|uniref:sugar transferase n=1 Tax=Anaerococcus sp. TaxID=1872515 RepID=UPI0027B8895C|nr:sugar transferase [Anaerococcus sp.]
MYRKDTERWLENLDLIFLDMLCLQIAYILAYGISGYGLNPYNQTIYRNIAFVIELIDLLVIFIYGTFNSVYKRGYYVEFAVTLKHAMFVVGLELLYLFMLQEGQNFSRLSLLLTFIIYIVLTYLVRIYYKKHKRRELKEEKKVRLLLISDEAGTKTLIEDIRDSVHSRYMISGLVVTDKNLVGTTIDGIEVVADEESVANYVCQEWIDEVLIVLSEDSPYPNELIDKLVETGVPVHYNVRNIVQEKGKKQIVEKLEDYVVITTSVNYVSTRQVMIKRLVDIVAGLVGCLITLLACIVIGPIIYIASPGPIFFAQDRVGRNGKIFKMYKFRSMYMDAEERKAELMKSNQYEDARMFKLDFDPRIIGNKILADGTKKKGIGDFIRKTSLDEFPQFFNVLKGDMSLVGTRPPLLSETALYEPHHRVRLAIKPGITGMWQVSGRSNITDFEEVVKLDREYIENWNIGLDFKILLKTFLVVFKRDGSK